MQGAVVRPRWRCREAKAAALERVSRPQAEHLPEGRFAALFHFVKSSVSKRPRLAPAGLRELLRYDAETGEFRWEKRMSRSVRAGDVAGVTDRDGYRRITIAGRIYPAHRLAWLYMTGTWCSVLVDHRDGDPSNNRWDNLRRATVSQNNANRRLHRNNKCGFKGVVRNQWGRFCASI